MNCVIVQYNSENICSILNLEKDEEDKSKGKQMSAWPPKK